MICFTKAVKCFGRAENKLQDKFSNFWTMSIQFNLQIHVILHSVI